MATPLAAGGLMDKSASALLSLPSLQSRMKCDPEGYEDELLLQLRHFEACLSIFRLTHSASSSSNANANSSTACNVNVSDPASSKELADMAMFLAHVAPFHPKHLAHFPQQILGLLQSKGDSLHSALRRQLTQALILLRNRQMIELVEILPVLMELQTLGDRTLRKLAALHIVQDVRRMNMKHRNESKNRALQNIVFQLLQDDNESRAKRALILLCELYKRKLWADERTSNTICTACFHRSSRILKAALSFLLGYENMEDEDEDESSEEEDEDHKPCVALSREAIYKAHHKGTNSSKRKKKAKLERVKRSLKKKQRNLSEAATCSSSPLQYLHDPQGFAEKLFSRLHTCNERFEVKLMMMKVISRTIGLHRLIILNFYPFLQKYVQPHQCEITHVLAAAVQACHDMVPPDAVESLLRQLVNQFVHDRARPEVIAVGLNVVREMCARMPLIMTRELLHDLALYKKSREKAVSAAARSIIAVFRQVYPSLLEKRDRGKAADLLATPKAFGQKSVPNSVPGIELLATNENEDSQISEDESGGFQSDSDDDHDSIEDEEHHPLSDEEESEMEDTKEGILSDDEGNDELDVDSDIESFESDVSGDDAKESESDDDPEDDLESEGQTHQVYSGKDDLKRQGCDSLLQPESKRRKLDEISKGSEECSLRELKKLVSNVGEKSFLQPAGEDGDGILSDADFIRIKKLQAKKAVQDALIDHGIGKTKRKEDVKLLRLENIHERRVNPDSLVSKIRQRREKEERIASVRAGQEDRESYKSRTSIKQSKTGGLSNRQKEKQKILPLAAKLAKASKSRNHKKAQRKLTKQFRGRKAWK